MRFWEKFAPSGEPSNVSCRDDGTRLLTQFARLSRRNAFASGLERLEALDNLLGPGKRLRSVEPFPFV